jgi:hypothetical protein
MVPLGLLRKGEMKQIERYIFRRMSSLTFWSLSAVTLLVLTTQVLIRVNVLTTTGQAFGAFAMLAATLIPSVVPIVAAFALLIGVSQVLSSMNSDSELVVVEAAGVPADHGSQTGSGTVSGDFTDGARGEQFHRAMGKQQAL